MNIAEKALARHYEWRGKLRIEPKMEIATREDMSMAYTPGVAEPCLVIQREPDRVWELTGKQNTVAVITDGTAVLGLGDIGPDAAMPVMEGKCVLFKAFADIDALPICVSSKDTDEIVRTVSLISHSFGGINLEDISAPRCIEIERRLKECCDIPVFHDDQHGTAVVVLAALINALKVVGKELGGIRLVVNGAGSAGMAITKLLLGAGLKEVILCDKQGALYEGAEWLNDAQAELASRTNRERRRGSLAEAIAGADAFIGVSGPGVLTEEMVRSMAPRSIVLAMANPTPEIMPDRALAAGARVVGTGRSDFPNQINNVLAFPGIFRGALDVRARDINGRMQIAASHAIASLIPENELSAENFIPYALDRRVVPAVAAAVSAAARESGVARC